MKPIASAAIWSALVFMACMLIAAAISVYAFDVYGRAWGRDNSFQVLVWIVIPTSAGVGVVSAVGFKAAGGYSFARPRIVGALVGTAVSAAVAVFAFVAPETQLSGLLLLAGLGMVTFVMAFAAAKFWPGGTAHAVQQAIRGDAPTECAILQTWCPRATTAALDCIGRITA